MEFFTEAVNIFRSDFFLPKSLRDCVRYIQVVRQNGNLKDRVNSDVWRANTEASSMKFAEFWVGMLKKCWNDVKMLGHGVVWKVESQENRVGTVVEVGGFCGVPMGVGDDMRTRKQRIAAIGTRSLTPAAASTPIETLPLSSI